MRIRHVMIGTNAMMGLNGVSVKSYMSKAPCKLNNLLIYLKNGLRLHAPYEA